MQILLILLLCTIPTVVLLLCIKRLWKLRYCQKIFVHSFHQLLAVNLIIYLESLIGMILFGLQKPKNDDTIWIIFFFILIFLSSTAFITRILRKYRIFLATFIEKGLLNYDKLICRKFRLTRKWNVSVYCVFTSLNLLISTIFYLLHHKFSKMSLFDYVNTYFLCVKSIEIVAEIIFSIKYLMKKSIKFVYKLESIHEIGTQCIIICFLATDSIIIYFDFGVLGIGKIMSLLFNDFFITKLLVKEHEKKPLLPPIYIITSSIFVIEIELVYECFLLFIENKNNQNWHLLLETLMEIQIKKMKNSFKTNKKFEEKLQKIDEILMKNIRIEKENDIKEKIEIYEQEIIQELDEDAFIQFMKSDYYKSLAEKIKAFNSNITQNQ